MKPFDAHQPPPGCVYISGGLIAFAHRWHQLTQKVPDPPKGQPKKGKKHG